MTHRDVLDAFAKALMEKETLDKADIEELFKTLPKWTKPPDQAQRPEPAFIDPTPIGVASTEAVGVAGRASAFAKVRNKAGRAIKGAKDGFRDDEGSRGPRLPVLKPAPGPTAT